jgi:small subunit ribosomal protein S14
MKSWIQRDKKKRRLFLVNESKRKSLKSLIYNRNLPFKVRWQANLLLSKLPRSSSLTRITNNCVISGRNHAVLQKFRLSRIVLRSLIADGLISGVKKSTW